MIRSFKDKRAAAVFLGKLPKGFPNDLFARARTRLAQLDAATRLDDLRLPSSNMLEALKEDRIGQHSIRVSRQWRVCFVWRGDGADDVEIVDYH